MRNSEMPRSNLWLQNAFLDSLLFSFGWLVVLTPLLFFRDDIYHAIRDSMSLDTLLSGPGLLSPAGLILVVLLMNYIHRHLTFALVYLEKEEFSRRPGSYIVLPIAFALLTAVFLHFGLFMALLTLSILWTMYHSVAQKKGITRIYARKAGYGRSWIDKGVIFSWFAWLVLAVAGREQDTLLHFGSGQTIMDIIGDYIGILTMASWPVLAIALGFTGLYVYTELQNRRRMSVPKNLYILSVLMLYAIFLYDFLVGYIVFAFTHAVEYIAFVNLYIKRKYRQRESITSLLARAARHQWVWSTAFSLSIVALCLAGIYLDRGVFVTYIVGSSFLHFIYDGWIWKVRRPDVGRPLDIPYAGSDPA